MGTIIVLAVAFVAMLTGPVVFAAIYYKRRQSTVLHINQDRVRDPRYFGKFFADMVQSRIPEIQGDVIRLSRDEAFLNYDTAKKEDYIEEIQRMVIARKKDFISPKTVKSYLKEIYCAKMPPYCRKEPDCGQPIPDSV